MSEQEITAGKLLVTEYEALKREQAARIGTRDNLVYATLAGMGLVAAVGLRQGSPASLLLWLPPVVVVLGWTRIANDIKVTHIARYLRCDVAARFTVLTGEPALGWEQAHRGDRHRLLRMVCQLVADLVLFVAAPAAALIVSWKAGHLAWPQLVVWYGEVLLVAAFGGVLAAYSGLFDQPAGTPDPPWWPCPWCDTRNLIAAQTCRTCGRCPCSHPERSS
jgi:hypothetical protein